MNNAMSAQRQKCMFLRRNNDFLKGILDGGRRVTSHSVAVHQQCLALAQSPFSDIHHVFLFLPLSLFCCPWRWHGPDAPNEGLFVLPYASACNRFLRTLPNFALCQRGPHVTTKESLANDRLRRFGNWVGSWCHSSQSGLFFPLSLCCFLFLFYFLYKLKKKNWSKRSLKITQGERPWLFWPTLSLYSLEWIV